MDNQVCLWDMLPLNEERAPADTNTQQNLELWVILSIYKSIMKNLNVNIC